jgi:hypothetical protein
MDQNNSPIELTTALKSMVELLGLQDLLTPDELDTGLREIEGTMLLVASEAMTAERQGVALRHAGVDFERFPHMARLHASVEDILTLELPRPLLDWSRRFLSQTPPEGLDALRTDFVRRAARDPMPLRRSLFRFLLFQGVRVNLVLRALLFPDEVFGVGMERDDLDEIAEKEMSHWLDSTACDDDEVRPFTLMVVAACEELAHDGELLRLALQPVKQELRSALAVRAKTEAALATMSAADALILRNEFAEEFEIQPLRIETLRTRHPAAFGRVKRGALYQRKSELAKLRTNNGPLIRRRRRLSLLDVVAEQIGTVQGGR